MQKPRPPWLAEKPPIDENLSMLSAGSADDFYEQIRVGNPLLACFQADWCGDCHALKPSLPELETTYATRLQFLEVDIDLLPELARTHEVTGIPSFILFAAGREVFRFVNPRRKSKDEVADFIEKGLALIPRSKE